ncbi:MAG: response regulator transcription factor [Clostridiales bacterium]|nr:response regulator transcription factor [Clostridiales bacterium]MBR5057776.1 response regulator transcription factor [Clostridiales bacterium]
MRYDCLIVDDEKAIADNTCEYFNMFDVKTCACYSMAEALSFFTENETGLVLLDINLGDGSGFELCKHIRESLNIPILFISARNTDDDKIIALNIGGDDYIEKPYSLGVLLAKVKVMLRRFGAMEEKPQADIFTDGELSVDKKNKTVELSGEQKKLTSMEFSLLCYLIENPDRLITKTELFDNVWKDKFTSDGTLNVHIRKLREAIESDPKNPSRIVTVWKEGYKYVTGAGK